jgi:hypothetical protein
MSIYGLSPGSICSLLTGVPPSSAVVVAVGACVPLVESTAESTVESAVASPVELVIELSAHADNKMTAPSTTFDNLDMSANLAMTTAKGWAVWA